MKRIELSPEQFKWKGTDKSETIKVNDDSVWSL